MNVTRDFERWATAFSGCNGGNLHGAIWFCGIEWGTGKDHEIGEELRKNVSKPQQIYQSLEDISKNAATGKLYPYGVKLIKLIRAMRLSDDYTTPFPFHRQAQFFQLNLVPIAFKEVDTQLGIDRHRMATGLPARDAHVQRGREYRLPQMRSWVQHGNPK